MSAPEPDAVVADAAAATPRRRRTGGIALVLVVLGTLVAGMTWVAVRGGDGAGAADGGVCPGSVRASADGDPDGSRPADRVPAGPTVPGLDGRLVPAADPSEIVLCDYRLPYRGNGRYPVAESSGVDLPSGASVSDPVPPPTGSGAADDLPLGRTAAHAPTDPSVRPLLDALHAATVQTEGYYTCAMVDFGTPAPQYLLRLSYDNGVVWVAGPTACASTNGVATSVVDLSEPVSWALNHATAGTTDGPSTDPSSDPSSATPSTSSDAEVTPSPVDPVPASPVAQPTTSPDPDASDPFATCWPDGTPIQAEDDPFVPFTPTSVLVCHAEAAGGPSTAVPRPAEAAASLAVTLNGLPPYTSDTECPVTEHPEVWRLLFADDAGHTASVFVRRGACPGVDDKVKAAAATPALFRQLGELD